MISVLFIKFSSQSAQFSFSKTNFKKVSLSAYSNDLVTYKGISSVTKGIF